MLQFCGIGDDEEEEAEQWDKWKSRKNMMSKRMGTGHYRQPQPLGMDDAPYEGVRNIVLFVDEQEDLRCAISNKVFRLCGMSETRRDVGDFEDFLLARVHVHSSRLIVVFTCLSSGRGRRTGKEEVSPVLSGQDPHGASVEASGAHQVPVSARRRAALENVRQEMQGTLCKWESVLQV